MRSRSSVSPRQAASSRSAKRVVGRLCTRPLLHPADAPPERSCSNSANRRLAVQAGRIQLGELDPRRLRALGRIQFQGHARYACHGAFEQAFVHVADLFDIQRTVRQCAPLDCSDLQRFQNSSTVRLSMGSGTAEMVRQLVPLARPSRNGKRSGSNSEPPKAGIRRLSCSMPP